MDFQAYSALFDTILNDPSPKAPYDKPSYLDYTKLNRSRMNRWMKTGILTDEAVIAVKKISTPQRWVVITEAWCGDAAHSIPFIQMLAEQNPLVTIDYELRDSEPFRINDFLTNGGKAIPKLVMYDASGKYLADWGPRPAKCQALFHELRDSGLDAETQKEELQKWYNANAGEDLQKELTALLSGLA
jgi:hypothetical protein